LQRTLTRLLLCAAIGAAAADTKPPTVPTHLTATSATASSVVLKWKASTDFKGSGVAGYDVFRNGSSIASTSVLTYTATGLAASTTYSFAVRARDSAGNVSALSSPVSVTTLASPCGAYPSTPTGLAVMSVSSSTANLLWNPVAPPSGCSVTYNVLRDGTQIANGLTTTNYLAGGLTASSTYLFAVSATDAFGNSLDSGPVGATTTAGGSGGGFPRYLFAPYTDVTLWPTPSLSGMATQTGSKFFSLGFIVAGAGCQASWGGYYNMSQKFLESDIASLRSQGGDVIPSFGGAVGTELAGACSTAATLQAQYQTVIDTYSLTRVDFDVEGAALADATSIDRRNKAIVALQTAALGAGKTLTVQFTLPGLPSGLTSQGISLLQNAIANGVNIGIVNVMTMDYGTFYDPNQMGQNAVNAMNATIQQLKTLYGTAKTDAQVRAMVGMTPMIGLNDVSPEVFTLADASTLMSAAQANGIGFLTFWSSDRDRQCSTSPVLSSTCSGVIQSPWAFTSIFESFTKP
jgi:chitodextrinase